MTVRQHLIKALDDFQCTQEVLASMLGIPKSTFIRWLHRSVEIPHHRLTLLALASVYYMRGDHDKFHELLSLKVDEPVKTIATMNFKMSDEQLLQQAVANYGENK